MASVVVMGLLVSLAAQAQSSDVTARAARLAELRQEVETLSNALELDKDELRGRLNAVEAQTVDLEVQIRREELRLERLLAEEEQQRALLASTGEVDEISPVVLDGIRQLKVHVTEGLPFNTEARLQALAELEQKLQAQEIRPEQAGARLWAFAEDERRLTRENALGRQVIALQDTDVLVDIARIGMVALYFKTPDGTYGQATQTSDGWSWTPIEDAAAAAEVSMLFSALSQGIRVGEFTLPNMLTEMQ